MIKTLLIACITINALAMIIFAIVRIIYTNKCEDLISKDTWVDYYAGRIEKLKRYREIHHKATTGMMVSNICLMLALITLFYYN